jgi:hypothetical protein
MRGATRNGPLLAALMVVLTLGACGAIRESRLNPFNWFGRSERAQPVAAPEAQVVPGDAREQVADVTALVIEPVTGGAIVRATGLTPRQGYWQAELVPQDVDDKGGLVFDFLVFAPPGSSGVSTPQSREIVVAYFLSNFKLQTIGTITVQGKSGARSARR